MNLDEFVTVFFLICGAIIWPLILWLDWRGIR